MTFKWYWHDGAGTVTNSVVYNSWKATFLQSLAPILSVSNKLPHPLFNSHTSDPANQGLGKRLMSWSRCGKLWLGLGFAGRWLSRPRVGDHCSNCAPARWSYKGEEFNKVGSKYLMHLLNPGVHCWSCLCCFSFHYQIGRAHV